MLLSSLVRHTPHRSHCLNPLSEVGAGNIAEIQHVDSDAAKNVGVQHPEGVRLNSADLLAHYYRYSPGLQGDKDVTRRPLRVHLIDARLGMDKKAAHKATTYLTNPDEFGAVYPRCGTA